jgi:hypothetical protein
VLVPLLAINLLLFVFVVLAARIERLMELVQMESRLQQSLLTWTALSDKLWLKVIDSDIS